MPAIEKNLLKGETIIYRTGAHWIVFFMPAVFLALSLACFVTSPLLYNVGLLLLLVTAILSLSSMITYYFSEFVVTNKRVIAKRGLFTRNVVGLMLSKTESIHVKQAIWARILNYGQINLVGTGGTNDGFTNVTDPFAYRQAILEAMNQESKK